MTPSLLPPASPIAPPGLLKLIAHEIRWQLLVALAHSDYCVNELVTRLAKPMNLISYHLRLLRDGALVQERRSSADGRDVYYSLNLAHFQALYQAALEPIHPVFMHSFTKQPAANQTTAMESQTMSNTNPPVRVLFLCTHNSARSQIAEALLRHLGGAAVEVYSAGTEVTRVHPLALQVLQEQGVDTSGLTSKHLNQFIGQSFDYVITVCDRAKESCPVFPGDPERIHWSFPDPSAVAEPDQQRLAFVQTFVDMERRLQPFLAVITRHARARTGDAS